MKPRRKFTGEYKAKLVLEMLSGQRSVAEIARKEGIKDTLLHGWRTDTPIKACNMPATITPSIC